MRDADPFQLRMPGVPVRPAARFPMTGSEAPMQTANSLPPNFLDSAPARGPGRATLLSLSRAAKSAIAAIQLRWEPPRRDRVDLACLGSGGRCVEADGRFPATIATFLQPKREGSMPTAKIHIHEGRYDESRLAKLGEAIQSALEAVLKISAR